MPERDLKFSFVLDHQKIQAARKDIAQIATEAKALDIQLKSLQKTAGSSGPVISNNLKRISANQVELRNEMLKGTRAIQEQQTVLDRYRRSLATAQNASRGGFGGGSTGGVGRVLSVVGGATNLAGLDTGISQLGSIASQATPLLQGMGASAAQVAAVAPLAGAALIAVSLAAKKFSDEMEANKKRLDNAIQGQRTYYELIQSGTRETIALGLEELKLKLAVAEATRRDVQAGKEALKDNPVADLIDFVSGTTASRLKELDTEIGELQAQTDAYTRALNSTQVATNSAKAAHEDYAAKLRANIEEQNRIREQAAQEEAGILQRAANQRVQIARRIAEQEAAALTNLQRALAEDRVKLGQAVADARLDYQREETRSAREHYRAMRKIREDAERQEFQLALDRDFAGLAQLGRDTSNRLSEEEERFASERKERLIAYKAQQADLQKAFIREREQRFRAYQQQLKDLRDQQVREIKAADEAAQVDLKRLRDRIVKELALRQDGYTAILELERQYLARLRAMVAGQSSGSGTHVNTTQPHEQVHPGTGGYAFGGIPQIGRPSLVNERPGQVESFKSGGSSVMLPGGMGLFTPFRSGRINSNGGGGINITMPVTVNGSTLAEIRRKLHTDIDSRLAYAFEKLTA